VPAPQGADLKLVIPILADGTLVVEGIRQPGIGFDPVKRGSGHLSGDQGGFGFILPEGTCPQIWQYQQAK